MILSVHEIGNELLKMANTSESLLGDKQARAFLEEQVRLLLADVRETEAAEAATRPEPGKGHGKGTPPAGGSK